MRGHSGQGSWIGIFMLTTLGQLPIALTQATAGVTVINSISVGGENVNLAFHLNLTTLPSLMGETGRCPVMNSPIVKLCSPLGGGHGEGQWQGVPPAPGSNGGGDGGNSPIWKRNIITNFVPNDFEAVEFTGTLHERIRVKSMYYELGFSDRSKIYGRRIVLNRLLVALDFLPSQYGFQIWDVYRPRKVQEKLFIWMQGEIRKKDPDFSDIEIYNEAKKYMSSPSKVGEKYCPPHLSGGAIDVTLYDIQTGKELDLGTVFDDCTECAHSGYFDHKASLTDREQMFHNGRILLRTALQKAGFVPYEFEWWHYDIGDIFWSRLTEQPQVFGPLFGDSEWP